MKKLTLLLVLLLVVALATSLLAEKKYALLKPAKNGQKSEAIPISKEQLDKILKSQANTNKLTKATATMGIPDTIANASTISVNWGIQVADTNSAYYDPPAACYIKGVGIVGQTWSTSPLAPGFNLMIHKAAVPWVWDPAQKTGDAWYTQEIGLPTLLGELMWGDFPVNIVDGERVWTDMIFLGVEPDNEGEPFVVSVVPFGDAAACMGTDAEDWNAGDPDGWKLAKYYSLGRSGHAAQFVVRDYVCSWLVAVEFYENTPPSVTIEKYGSVLAADAKTLACAVTDIDANDANQAGAVSVSLFYKVDDGAETQVACALASGTDTDGVWEGTIPAGYMSPGQTLTYYFVATDKAGLSTTSSSGSFGYFQKTTDILVFYNDNGTSYAASIILSPYYDNLWVDANDNKFPYDVWVGLADGPLSSTLVNLYDNIIQIDAYSPATMNDNVLGPWFAAGPKKMFWSSQEWGYSLTGGADSTFAEDDWHNAFMGIGTIGPMDINANYTEAFPINAVAGDVISGDLAAFVGDSLQLYHYSSHELNYNDWCDAMTAGTGAVVCFTDSAQGRTMGVHKESANGTKTVFLTFDQLCLDTGALPSYTVTDGYHWTEPNVSSMVGNALNWFGIGTSVDENPAALVAKYDLSQNYPNPFNPETQISYSIAKAGHVKLAVYNVLGQKVADLVDEFKAANTYKVTLDASNLTSGIYFYRLEVGDFSKTMKMMLLQ